MVSAEHYIDGSHSGRAESTTISSVNARPIDPDRPVWERQQGESSKAYKAFTDYLHSEERVVRNHGAAACRWSPEWSWGYRAFEFDKYMAQVDLDEMVRYRRKMNERHRAISRSFQGKVIQWLASADVTQMRASEIARWFEVAVRVERAATGIDDRFANVDPANAADDPEQSEPEEQPMSFADVMEGLDLHNATTARLLHEAMKSAGPGGSPGGP